VHERWGTRAATIVNNHRARIIGSGTADPDTLDYVARVLGDAEIRQVLRHRRPRTGQGSTTESSAFRALAPAKRPTRGTAGAAPSSSTATCHRRSSSCAPGSPTARCARSPQGTALQLGPDHLACAGRAARAHPAHRPHIKGRGSRRGTAA